MTLPTGQLRAPPPPQPPPHPPAPPGRRCWSRRSRAWTTSPFTPACCCATSRSPPTASPASSPAAAPSTPRWDFLACAGVGGGGVQAGASFAEPCRALQCREARARVHAAAPLALSGSPDSWTVSTRCSPLHPCSCACWTTRRTLPMSERPRTQGWTTCRLLRGPCLPALLTATRWSRLRVKKCCSLGAVSCG